MEQELHEVKQELKNLWPTGAGLLSTKFSQITKPEWLRKKPCMRVCVRACVSVCVCEASCFLTSGAPSPSWQDLPPSLYQLSFVQIEHASSASTLGDAALTQNANFPAPIFLDELLVTLDCLWVCVEKAGGLSWPFIERGQQWQHYQLSLGTRGRSENKLSTGKKTPSCCKIGTMLDYQDLNGF